MRVIAAICVVIALCGQVSAQSLSPMRGEVRSFSDRFAVRVQVGNPYGKRMRFNVTVYDRNFFPETASVTPSHIEIAGGATAPVLVVVPFNGEQEKRIRICAEGLAYQGNSTRIRTQVCGKFLARSYMP